MEDNLKPLTATNNRGTYLSVVKLFFLKVSNTPQPHKKTGKIRCWEYGNKQQFVNIVYSILEDTVCAQGISRTGLPAER